MEWLFVLGLGAVTLIVIGLVIFLGLKLNKAVMKRTPEIATPLNITLAGTVLWACVVGFWLICLILAKLYPGSALGAFIGTVDGIASVFVASIIFAGVASAILEKLGFPIATREPPT